MHAFLSNRRWRDWRHRLLTAGLLFVVALQPVVATAFLSGQMMQTAAAGVLLAFVVLGKRRRTGIVATVLFVLALLCGLTFYFTWGTTSDSDHAAIAGASFALHATFTVYVGGIILRDVVAERRVTLDSVFGAVCVYLLLGTLWANLYLLVYLVDPTTFIGPGLPGSPDDLASPPTIHEYTATFHYFSYATLTTLGFGDITPTGHIARTLAWMEAVTGQLFLAVLVARLVALETAQQVEEYEEQKRTGEER